MFSNKNRTQNETPLSPFLQHLEQPPPPSERPSLRNPYKFTIENWFQAYKYSTKHDKGKL